MELICILPSQDAWKKLKEDLDKAKADIENLKETKADKVA